MTAFILVHLSLGMQRVTRGLFTPVVVWRPGMNLPYAKTHDRDNIFDHLAFEAEYILPLSLKERCSCVRQVFLCMERLFDQNALTKPTVSIKPQKISE